MKKCLVETCSDKHHALGYCRKHHTRFIRNGTAESKYDKDKYTALGGIRDTAPGRRGSLAVNIINDVKFKAKQRGKSWELDHQQAFALIISNCNYCGAIANWPMWRNGIDRVDNDIGYTVENSVPCCFTCNSAKGKLTTTQFKAWVQKVYENMNK